MTDQEIIGIAREAGIHLVTSHPMNEYDIHHSELMAFARLIAKRQREIDAALCADNCAGYNYDRGSQGPCLSPFDKECGGRHHGMTYASAILEQED